MLGTHFGAARSSAGYANGLASHVILIWSKNYPKVATLDLF